MKTLTKYSCKEFIKLMFLCQLIFMAIYLTVDFIQKIDNFIEAASSSSAVFGYFLFKTPFIILQMIPATTMLAVILLFCIMKKNNEITAMKACGVSVFSLSKPIIALSVFIAAFVFVFSEFVVPYASTRSIEIWNEEVKKDKQAFFYGQKHIWYRGKNAIYDIKFYDSKNLVMKKMTFYFFDDSFHLVKRIDAGKGIWEEGRWKLQNGIIQRLDAGDSYGIEPFEEIFLDIPEGPDSFVKRMKRPEEMGYWQLKEYAENVGFEGYDATTYLVDMNIKLAFPFINFIMIMLGIPIAIGMKKGGTPLAISLGVVACFVYLVVFGVSRSFGISGILPPVISAWLANVVFFFIGSYLFTHLES
ncbi:LPS export ABC transporter permease LptG [Thermodesulfobacteriota bacterium]